MLAADPDVEPVVEQSADVDKPGVGHGGRLAEGRRERSRQALASAENWDLPACGSTRRVRSLALAPASLTTFRLLANNKDREPDDEVPALSDEAFPAKPERRGVEMDPGGIEPPSRNGSTTAILRA